MENKDVPYIVHEGVVSRFERVVKRLIIALIISVILLFASNMAWLYKASQYDYETYDISSDGDSSANYQTGSGVIINGGSNSSSEENP